MDPSRQRKRQQLVNQFQRDPAVPAVSDDERRLDGAQPAGGEYRHQCRSAVESGRAGTAHRAVRIAWGRSPVQVYLLVTEETIEEKLLATLSAKHDLRSPRSTWNPTCGRSRSLGH